MENNRINFVDIAGTKYPLTFSLGAAKAISRKYGSLEKMFEKLQNAEDTFEQLDAVIFVLETLIRQGCAYLNKFEKNVPVHEEGTSFNGEKFEPVTAEELEVGINIFDMSGIVEAISTAIRGSSDTTVEVESNGEGKNETSPIDMTVISGSMYGVED